MPTRKRRASFGSDGLESERIKENENKKLEENDDQEQDDQHEAKKRKFNNIPFSDADAFVEISEVLEGEGVFQYVNRKLGKSKKEYHSLYQKLIGAANEFKDGDIFVGVCAKEEESRKKAKRLLQNTKIHEIHEHPLYKDEEQALIWETTEKIPYEKIKDLKMQEFKDFVLSAPESDIKEIMPGLCSDVIGCLVKLCTNEDLIKIGQKIFNPLPNSKIGSKGYLSARIQPNSPSLRSYSFFDKIIIY